MNDNKNKLLDDEAFIRAAQSEFLRAGNPGTDELTKRRVWGRIQTKLESQPGDASHNRSGRKPMPKSWWTIIAGLPVAAAAVLYIFSAQQGGVVSQDIVVMDSITDGVKGAGDYLPVSLEVLEAKPGGRFVAVDSDSALALGTGIALMIHGPQGKSALVTMQIDDQPHEIIATRYTLLGAEGSLVADENDLEGKARLISLPATAKKVRFCAVGSGSTEALVKLVPQVRQGGPKLPPMMECQTVRVDAGKK